MTRDSATHLLCYHFGVPMQPPSGVKTTTIRIPLDLLQRVRDSSRADHRSVNAQVITLLTEALDTRDHEKAAR